MPAPQRRPLRSRSLGFHGRLERTAEEVHRILEQRHRPHGGILDPIFEAPDSEKIRTYTRAGDSAIWTGHYLAAEVYRYVATGSPEAYRSAVNMVREVGRFLHVTGTHLVARAVLPADSPYREAILREEAHHRYYESELDGEPVLWIGNTSRDQYMGFFFGLSVAFEWLHDPAVRADIRDIVTRAIDFLRYHDWAVRMPNGETSTVFWHRVDQRLAILQVGRQVYDERFSGPYRRERLVGSTTIWAPIAIEVLDPHSSYFKFNLVTAGMFCLIRSELSDHHRGKYLDAYRLFRRTVDDHGNAHFDMIDRVLEGPDERRDERIVRLIAEWIRRPRRDFWIDWRGQVAECGENRACEPLPVIDRVRTDFVWQRSPFQMYGGGDGFIETAGIDYLLPYWMARAYGVLPAPEDEPRSRGPRNPFASMP